jgi:hypothetical protein
LLATLAGACSLVTDLSSLSGAPVSGALADARDTSDSTNGVDAGGASDGSTVTTADAAVSGVAFVNSAGVSSNGATASLTVTLQEAPREHDLLLALVYNDLAEASTPSTSSAPAGWSVESNVGYWSTFYAFATATSGTSFTFAFTKAGSFGLPASNAAIAVYRGVDNGNPFDSAQVAHCPGGGSDTATACTVSSITTTRADTRLVLLSGLDGANNAPSWTAPSGMVERADLGGVAVADRPMAKPGATGAVPSVHVVTGWSSYVNLLALAPPP